jgi:hypothetical protein
MEYWNEMEGEWQGRLVVDLMDKMVIENVKFPLI